jgi:Flp pilus assembly protein TadD
MLSKDLAKAEETLGRAHERAKADPRVSMNFAVVLAIEGRQAEAEQISKADVPPEEANARVAELKRLLTKKDIKPERNASRAPGTTTAHTD